VVFSVSVPDILHNGLSYFKQTHLNTEFMKHYEIILECMTAHTATVYHLLELFTTSSNDTSHVQLIMKIILRVSK
jgi:hypothetical protein